MKSSSSKIPHMHQACGINLKACGSRKTQRRNRQCSDLQMKSSSSKNTASSLRDELPSSRFEKDAAVQQAVQHLQMKSSSSANTASSLRDELKSLRFEKDATVQQAVQRSADEILQLKKHPHQACGMSSRACGSRKTQPCNRQRQSADEILQLENTASSLRDELESLRFEFESKLQKNISEKVDEHSHLKETIAILRAQLDEGP